MAVGAIEPQFFAALLAGLGLSVGEVPSQFDIGSYARMRDVFTERFAGKTRDDWAQIFAGTEILPRYPPGKQPEKPNYYATNLYGSCPQLLPHTQTSPRR